MELAHSRHPGAIVVVPSGRLDHENCDAFRVALQPHLDACAADRLGLVFDLSRMEYVSSAGLRCFMLAGRQVKEASGRMLVAAMQPVVAEIFQISRFNLLFPTFARVDEALETLKPA